LTDVSTPIAVVPMRRRHLRGVVAIEAVTNHRPWSRDLFASELVQSSSHCFVAVAPRSVVVGFGCLLTTGFEAHVTNIAVDPERRHLGIATMLMLRLVRETLALGLDDVTLEVRQSNHAAIALYERFGFVAEGVRPKYYQELDEDAVIMWARGLAGEACRRRLEAIESAVRPST
jgi:ribosomal-protein-alanine N-acetyltransferase